MLFPFPFPFPLVAQDYFHSHGLVKALKLINVAVVGQIIWYGRPEPV